MIRVDEAVEDAQLERWLFVRNELEPDDPILFEQLLARRAAEPQRRELIATVDGDVAGVATVGPKGSPSDLAYGHIGVRDAWQQHGVDVALLDAVCVRARELGRTPVSYTHLTLPTILRV